MTTTDIDALVARGRSTFEGVPRNGLAYEMADALERQQAVVEAVWQLIEAAKPPPHAVYRVVRSDKFFDATPCYGMHQPWWVPQNGFTGEESAPVVMEPTDYWAMRQKPLAALDAPPEGDG